MVVHHAGIKFTSSLLLLSSCSSLQDSPAVQDPPVPIAIADPLTETLTLYLGGRSFQEDLEPADNHTLVGIEYAKEAPGAAVGWEFGINYSEKALSGFSRQVVGDLQVNEVGVDQSVGSP